MSRATYISALMLSIVSLSICFGSGGDWRGVLNLLNEKRSDVGKDPVSVSHPEDIDMDGVSAIKAGTEEILSELWVYTITRRLKLCKLCTKQLV